jgi:hypothetical protein
MTRFFKHDALKFAMVSAVLIAAPLVHAASSNSYVRNTAFENYSAGPASASFARQPSGDSNSYVRNTAFEDYSGINASARLARQASDRNNSYVHNTAFEDLSGTHAGAKSRGMAGAPGEKGEPGSAGTKRDLTPGTNVFDINGDVPGGCSQYLRCSGY